MGEAGQRTGEGVGPGEDGDGDVGRVEEGKRRIEEIGLGESETVGRAHLKDVEQILAGFEEPVPLPPLEEPSGHGLAESRDRRAEVRRGEHQQVADGGERGVRAAVGGAAELAEKLADDEPAGAVNDDVEAVAGCRNFLVAQGPEHGLPEVERSDLVVETEVVGEVEVADGQALGLEKPREGPERGGGIAPAMEDEGGEHEGGRGR
jgi:hypothetical protein